MVACKRCPSSLEVKHQEWDAAKQLIESVSAEKLGPDLVWLWIAVPVSACVVVSGPS